MVRFQDFQKINDFEWEIPSSFRHDMRVPVRVFATKSLLQNSLDDQSFDQAVNAATLPGVIGRVLVMPDVHQGYGFPIGGVAATRISDGVISPGAIGYDINCGVRLLASTISAREAEPYFDRLASALDAHCPSGVGTKGVYRLNDAEFDQVCRLGSRWAIKQGLASDEDVRRTEEGGMLEGADPHSVSARARERGRSQLGTLGSGNHFLEVDVVDEIFDLRAGAAMGLEVGVSHADDPLWISRVRSPGLHRLCPGFSIGGPENIKSSSRIGNWFARRSSLRRVRVTWMPCAARQIMLLQIVKYWPTRLERPSRRFWQAKLKTGTFTRSMTLLIIWVR